MLSYRYTGRNKQGLAMGGHFLGESKGQAAQALEEQGIWLTSLQEAPDLLRPRTKRIKVGVLAPFCRQLAFTLTSGISLMGSLALIQSEANTKEMNGWISLILAQLQQGKSFQEAISQTKWQVPAMLMEFVTVGENRGNLDQALTQAADYLESEVKLRKSLLAAFTYPALVLLVILGAILAMFLIVVPALVETYGNFGVPVPLATRWVIGCGHFLGVYGLWLVLGMGILVVGLMGAKPWTLVWWQESLIKVYQRIPLVHKLLATSFYVKFSRSLGELLEGGVLLLNALAIIEKNNPQFLFSKELQEITDQSAQGKSLAASLSHCTFIPLMARQMIMVGEESGRMGAMLLRTSQYYEEQLRAYTMNLAKVLEPLLIVLLGLVVLLIAGGLFLPMVTSYQYIL